MAVAVHHGADFHIAAVLLPQRHFVGMVHHRARRIGQGIASPEQLGRHHHVLVGGNGPVKAARRLIGAAAVGSGAVGEKEGLHAVAGDVRLPPGAGQVGVIEGPGQPFVGRGGGIGHLPAVHGGHVRLPEGPQQLLQKVGAHRQGVLGEKTHKFALALRQRIVAGAAVVEGCGGYLHHLHPLPIAPGDGHRVILRAGVDDDDLRRHRLGQQRVKLRLQVRGGVMGGYDHRHQHRHSFSPSPLFSDAPRPGLTGRLPAPGHAKRPSATPATAAGSRSPPGPETPG